MVYATGTYHDKHTDIRPRYDNNIIFKKKGSPCSSVFERGILACQLFSYTIAHSRGQQAIQARCEPSCFRARYFGRGRKHALLQLRVLLRMFMLVLNACGSVFKCGLEHAVYGSIVDLQRLDSQEQIQISNVLRRVRKTEVMRRAHNPRMMKIIASKYMHT
jgi:hypothetical protein